MSEKEELLWARGAGAGAIALACYFGISPPGFVAQVVALAFGYAAATFFPIIVLGIFSKRTTKEGAIAGMLTGLISTSTYVVLFTPNVIPFFEPISTEYLLFGIKPTSFGVIGMLLNMIVTIVVSRMTNPPPAEVQHDVEAIRYPSQEEEMAVVHH